VEDSAIAGLPPSARSHTDRPAPPRTAGPLQNSTSPPVQEIEEIEEIEEIKEVAVAAPARPKTPSTGKAPAAQKDKRQPAKTPAAEAEPAAEGAAEPDAEPAFRLRNLFRNASAMTVSTIIHMAVVLLLAILFIEPQVVVKVREVIAEVLEEPELTEELAVELENQLVDVTEPTDQAFSSSLAIGDVGASGPQGLIAAPTVDKALLEQVTNSEVNVEGVFIDVPSSKKLIVEAPDGQVGDARAVVDSYQEALDRITQEILWMLDKGPVLVVWAFDQSESMKDDQQEIRDRIEHVYRQLGLVSKSNEDALQTVVVSYGDLKSFQVHTREPTHDRSEIMTAIDEVPLDKSGEEFMCSAVLQSISMHRQYAQKTRRQMALIVVTDESGNRKDNDAQLERAIAEAKAARCRIYMLGREAVFGYPYVHMRWVHPQTRNVHWLPIDRGPETAFAEQLQTDGFHRRYDAHPAGFGPFECSRLGRETGGIFFMLPSLETNLVHGQKRNYDMEAPYFPDLRSKLEVKADIDRSPLRTMLEKVIYDLNPYIPEIRKIIEMRMEFSTDFDALARQIRHEQGKAVVYLTYLARAEQEIANLADARKQESSPRWQANYDLLYGQVIAYQARMYEYGAYLEEFLQSVQAYAVNPGNPQNTFKPPPKFKPPNLTHVHWDIRTRQRTITGEKVQPYIERASEIFKQIMEDHPSTPWAARAEFELRRGFGVELVPDYDGPHPTPTGTPIPIPKL